MTNRDYRKIISNHGFVKTETHRLYSIARTLNIDNRCYASFHMQNRISRQSCSTVMPCTGRNGSGAV